MLSSRSSDPTKESLQNLIQNDKFYSRLLSKDSSAANPSFRVYYGVASGSVPFLWESQPGTPKNSIPAATLPPLTPPPSFHVSTPKPIPACRKTNLIHTLLPRLNLKKAAAAPRRPPPLVALSSSSTSSSSSSSGSHRRAHRRSSPASSFSSSHADDEDSGDEGSPTSTLCFGASRHGSRACCSSLLVMRNAFSSVVGAGSGHHGSKLPS